MNPSEKKGDAIFVVVIALPLFPLKGIWEASSRGFPEFRISS